MKLPLEIIEYIYSYLTFDKIIYLSQHVTNIIYQRYLKNELQNNTINLLKKYSFSKKTLDYFYTKNLKPSFKYLFTFFDSYDDNLYTYIHNKYSHPSYYCCKMNLFDLIQRYDNLKTIKWFYINCKESFDDFTIELCCKHGRSDILKFLNDKNYINNIDIYTCINVCIENINLNIDKKNEVILWLYKNKKDFFTESIIIEICNKYPEILYILYKDIPDNVLNFIKYKAKIFNKWEILNFFKEKQFIKA